MASLPAVCTFMSTISIAFGIPNSRSAQIASIGETVSFSCTKSSPHEIRWMKYVAVNTIPTTLFIGNNRSTWTPSRYTVNVSGSTRTSQLTISNTQLDDSGVFICKQNDGSEADEIAFELAVTASWPTCSITTRPLSNSNETFLALTCTLDYSGPCPPVISCLPELDKENVTHSNFSMTVNYPKMATVDRNVRPDKFTCKVDFWSSTSPGTRSCDISANSFTWSVYKQTEAIDTTFRLSIVMTIVGIVSTVVVVVLVLVLVAFCCPKRIKCDATDSSSPAAATNGIANILMYSMIRKTNSSQKAENTVGRDQNDVYNETPQVPCYVSESKYINAPDDDRVTRH